MSKNMMIIRLKSSLTELENLRCGLKQFGESNRLTRKNIFDINLVLDELFTNIVSYGLSDDVECVIRISISEDHKVLTLQVEDCGIPFNPADAEAPDLEKGIEERTIGGMGIHIVKSIMDDIQYQRKNDMNILTLTKRL